MKKLNNISIGKNIASHSELIDWEQNQEKFRKHLDSMAIEQGKVMCLIPSWETPASGWNGIPFDSDIYYEINKEKILTNIINEFKTSANKEQLEYMITRSCSGSKSCVSVDKLAKSSINQILEAQNKEQCMKCIFEAEQHLCDVTSKLRFNSYKGNHEVQEEDACFVIDNRYIDVIFIDYEILNKTFFYQYAMMVMEWEKKAYGDAEVMDEQAIMNKQMKKFVEEFSAVGLNMKLMRVYYNMWLKFLSVEDIKEAENEYLNLLKFKSNNLRKKLNVKNIFNAVRENGGILTANSEGVDIKKSGDSDEKMEVRIFFSPEALFAWEFYITFKQKGYCVNCDKKLNKLQSQQKYCEDEKCQKDRNRQRQYKKYQKDRKT